MKHTTSQGSHSLPTRLIGFLLCLWLAGCETTPQQVEAPPSEVLPVTEEDPLAALTLPDSVFAAEFASAEQALLALDWMTASAVLEQIDPLAMSATDRVYHDYLQARIAWLAGDETATRAALERATARDLHPALTSKLLNFMRHRAELAGDYLLSARLGDAMLAYAPDEEAAAAVRRMTWRDLQRLNPGLLPAPASASDPQWQAWLELAHIALDENILAREADLRQWQARHPSHPAAATLPGGLAELLSAEPPPQKVALLLPLSGRLAAAGRAIRDGYLAAHYTGLADGDRVPELLLLDSQAFPSASAAYQEAIAAGAGLVVGPLTRGAVRELGQLPMRPIPVLALNRADTPVLQDASALVQFSLAVEDEVRQLAALAFGRGARRALVVRPAGRWGDEAHQAFEERWRELGGTVAGSAEYEDSDSYADSLTSALHLDRSQERAARVRSLLAGAALEFTPRRRRDIDAVFLLSRTPAEARALKPLLSYYYAGALPVYAVPNVHRGFPEPGDKELDGVRIVDLPWLLGSNPSLRVAIASGDTGTDAYPRLNALGADAYRLQAGFRQLRAGPDALIRGDSGLLSMDPQLRIHRETRPATFDDGELRSL